MTAEIINLAQYKVKKNRERVYDSARKSLEKGITLPRSPFEQINDEIDKFHDLIEKCFAENTPSPSGRLTDDTPASPLGFSCGYRPLSKEEFSKLNYSITQIAEIDFEDE